MSTVKSAAPCTFEEINELFTIIINCWHHHPNHFGYQVFDDFLKALPNTYYQLINYQQQLHQYQLQQQQQQQQQQQPQQPPVVTKKDVDTNTKPTQKKPALLQPTKPLHKAKRCSVAPALVSILEEKELTTTCTSSPCLTPVLSPSPSPFPNEKLNPFAADFVPSQSDDDDTSISSDDDTLSINSLKNYKKQAFVPKHAARAKLNIYIPKHMTKTLLAAIVESFPNTGTLYYYLDISTALQINDGEMEMLTMSDDEKIVLINFDLHSRDTKQLLYAVVVPNDEHKIEANTYKWLWKIKEFMTAEQILSTYDIDAHDLPLSSRAMTGGLFEQYKTQLMNINGINDINMLRNYKWTENEIKQIGSSQKSKKGKKPVEMKCVLDKEFWIYQCQQSWTELAAIPIVVYENRDINQHWLEWVKMIYIESENCYIGVSFKYNDDDKKWQINSICLDKGDIHNKHRLIGLARDHQEAILNVNYDQFFDRFNTRITEVEWR